MKPLGLGHSTNHQMGVGGIQLTHLWSHLHSFHFWYLGEGSHGCRGEVSSSLVKSSFNKKKHPKNRRKSENPFYMVKDVVILVLGRHPVCQQTSDMLLSLLNNMYIYIYIQHFICLHCLNMLQFISRNNFQLRTWQSNYPNARLVAHLPPHHCWIFPNLSG